MATPFLKWAGGKRQLLKEIIPRLPTGFGEEKNRRYAEPFIGGGAVLFHLFELGIIDEAFISDYNPELILAYRTLKMNVEGVIEQLGLLQEEYDASPVEQRKNTYFQMRKSFNEGRKSIDFDNYSAHWCERAAQMICLNKTGFNGLFRVNSKGEFNVPPSNLANKKFLDVENLRSVSLVLQNVEVVNGDFSECREWVDENTFIYFDPPYRPLNPTSFTTYSTSDFNDKEQRRLANFVSDLNSRGVRVMLSNSDPKNVNEEDDFFEEIFRTEDGFNIARIQAIRTINSKGDGRGAVSELLIMNY